MLVRKAEPDDSPEIEAFLSRHAETSMFLRSNLREHGPCGGTAQVATTMWLGVRDGAFTAVLGITTSGHVLVQAPEPGAASALLRTRNAVVFGLAKLADSRDSDSGRHLDRMRLYVTILASEMAKTDSEITPQYVADLAVASSLHDIGKVGVPDAVLLKPGRLTPAERRAMELHTSLGSECLAAIQAQLGDDEFLALAQRIALSHHEHWDGSGYPQGLQGKQIPLAARIVALADVYDALTSKRPYRGPIEPAETTWW